MHGVISKNKLFLATRPIAHTARMHGWEMGLSILLKNKPILELIIHIPT